jgi:YidC/Oxa1 family membrane protein insertase
MFSYIWHTVFFDPVYNGLVYFIDIIPGGDVGLAIIATVAVVKLILFPLSLKAIKTQKLMKELEPKLKAIKEQFKDKREEQAKAMMAVYKEAGMNPFASIALIFIQLPFVIALYLAVSSGGGIALPEINTAILYTFVPEPVIVSMNFLGQLDITGKSLALALLAGITQYITMYYAMPPLPPKVAGAPADFKDDFMRNMQLQMKYVMPIMIVFIAYTFSAAIALYFVVSNVVTLIQEIFVSKHR